MKHCYKAENPFPFSSCDHFIIKSKAVLEFIAGFFELLCNLMSFYY